MPYNMFITMHSLNPTWYRSEWASSAGRGGELGELPSRLMCRDSERDWTPKKEKKESKSKAGWRLLTNFLNVVKISQLCVPLASLWGGRAGPELHYGKKKHNNREAHMLNLFLLCINQQHNVPRKTTNTILSFKCHLVNNLCSYLVWICIRVCV